MLNQLYVYTFIKSRQYNLDTLYYHICKRKKTVYNIELKSEIGNVTQNHYKASRAEEQKIIFKKEIYRLAIKHLDVIINIS